VVVIAIVAVRITTHVLTRTLREALAFALPLTHTLREAHAFSSLRELEGKAPKRRFGADPSSRASHHVRV